MLSDVTSYAHVSSRVATILRRRWKRSIVLQRECPLLPIFQMMFYHDGLRTTRAEKARHSSISRASHSDPLVALHRLDLALTPSSAPVWADVWLLAVLV